MPADADFALARLRFLLQLAYSGELGAIRAYLGHKHSLRKRAERNELLKILREEIRHRRCLLEQLTALGASPDPRRERKMELIGRAIAASCRVGGWFFPMYGAGLLESQNVREYEVAARLALVAGRTEFLPALLEMAEVEWDHERYFREQASRHPFWRLMPKWRRPPPRERIRESFREFERSPEREVPAVRAPLLVR